MYGRPSSATVARGGAAKPGAARARTSDTTSARRNVMATTILQLGQGTLALLLLVGKHGQKVLPVEVVLHGLGNPTDRVGPDVAPPIGDLLEQATLSPCRSSRVWMKLEACSSDSWVPVSSQAHAAAEHLDVQLAAREVGAVDVGDLQLAARRGLEAGGDVDHVVVVEVEPGDGVGRSRAARASPRVRRRGPSASNSTTP